MKCDRCSNKATVFLTQLVEGNMKKVCLCEKCATEQGVTDPMGFSLADMLMGGVQTTDLPSVPMPGSMTCKACGFTLNDFRKVGRLGCSECYTAFKQEIANVIPNMHTDIVHEGKIPEGMMELREREERVEKLNNRLQAAISEEDYESAAKIRDELSGIEG